MSLSNARPERLQPPFDHYEWLVLSRAWERLHEDNEHFMLCIVGEEGSGKSMTAIRIAEELDPNFTADRVIFDVEELLRRLRDEEYEEGQAFVLDEAGVSLGRRTWQDRAQVLANQALQLIRSHNLALIFTLPALGELDSQAVSRLQAYYEIKEKVPDEYVKGVWYYIKTDRSDEGRGNYTPKPRVRHANKPTERVDWLKFGPPEGEVVDEYLTKKEQHQKETYDEAIDALSDEDATGKDEEESQTPQDIAQDIAQEGIQPFVSKHGTTDKPYINKDLIRAKKGVSHSDARAVKSLLEDTFELDQLEALER